MSEIVYRSDKKFDLDAWLALYHSCDWNREWVTDRARAMLDHAYLIITAWDGSNPVGSLIVLSDGVNYATIEDVVVRPDQRRQGIGSEIMRLALKALSRVPANVVKLQAIPGVEGFYESVGFHVSGETVMAWSEERRAEL